MTDTTDRSPPSGRFLLVVQRSTEQFGDHLVGVLVFGSWARGDAGDSSDVDLLVVIDPEVTITRGLYAEWDEADRAPTRDG